MSAFMAVLDKYPGLITMTLAAHTHMDEYRVLSPGNVLEITPAISPVFGNNPAFKVFSIASDTLKPTDYQVFNYNLAAQPGRFESYYQAYSMSPFSTSVVRASSATRQQRREAGVLPRQLLFRKQRLEPDYEHQLADLLERDRGDG